MYFKPLLILMCLSWASALDPVSKDLVITSFERTMDMSSQLVKINNKITFTNSGQSSIKSFHFTVDEDVVDKVAFIGATSGSSDKTYLRVTETKLKEPEGLLAWNIEFKKPLSAGAEQTVQVEVYLAKCVQPFPEEIIQKDKQLVLFTGNHYAYTPYQVKSQTTKVTLSTSSIENYSKLKPTSQAESTISYGPYKDVSPFSYDQMSVHFENNNPFLVVKKLERTIELSMWGNIAVEEIIDIRHEGAKLKGSFSRYEYQRESSGVSSVKSFKTVLPASAMDVYYRDDIGNISTSALRNLDEAVELDIRPRFPLFGGWKTHYLIGYNVPSYEYLFNKGNTFVLNMRMIDHIFDDMLVEDFSLKIILPEGSVIGKLHTPFPVVRGPDSKHFTYLDTSGRPVVNVHNSKFMTEKHIEDFQLEFEFKKFSMFNEPLLLIIAYFTFFLLAIIYVRLDFSITKDETSEAKLKVAGISEKIIAHQEKRVLNHALYEDAIVKLKSSKDVTAFQNTTKKLLGDNKSETQAINDLAAQLRATSNDAADKVSELQKAEREFREHQANQGILVEKLVSGKLAKQQFIDQESAIVRKMTDCSDRMQTIVSHLRV